jgi:uncharacterized protein YceK
MRQVRLAVMAAVVIVSLSACASGMQRDSTQSQSYQRQRAVADAMDARNQRDRQMEQQRQQEQAIERAGGSPIPR